MNSDKEAYEVAADRLVKSLSEKFEYEEEDIRLRERIDILTNSKMPAAFAHDLAIRLEDLPRILRDSPARFGRICRMNRIAEEFLENLKGRRDEPSPEQPGLGASMIQQELDIIERGRARLQLSKHDNPKRINGE